jgi:predicted MPP superfamily phosphohydrolase
VDQVNNLGANLILIGGDLIDEPPGKVKWVGEQIARLEAEDGVWAVTGNHEFYTSGERFEKMMQKAGAVVLRDDAVSINDKIFLVGLDDVTGAAQFRQRVTPIREMLDKNTKNLPVILMHHTPRRIKEAEAAGVDLMISGHAHDGQLWPFNYITRAVYGVKTGYSRIGDLQFYLTSGIGTWGPPMRVLTQSELVVFTLEAGEGQSDVQSAP